MGFNSRGDVFATGTAEGSPVTYLSPTVVAALPSGDYPGKTVGDVAPLKRKKGNYAGIKKSVLAGEIQPSTMEDGVLVDGHTRAAAHLALNLPMPVRGTPTPVGADKTFRSKYP